MSKETVVQKNIRYLIRKSRLTQEQFAERINVKRSLVGAWCEGRSEPNSVAEINICHQFGLKIEDFRLEDFETGERTVIALEPSKKGTDNTSAEILYEAFVKKDKNIKKGILYLLGLESKILAK